MMLNSEILLKILKGNNAAFVIVVKGLMGANRGANAHWNLTVNTITVQVMRSYMELNRELFEKISATSASEETRRKEAEARRNQAWAALEAKFN